MIPTMAELKAHVAETSATMAKWAREKFTLPALNPTLKFLDRDVNVLGHASWSRNQTLRITTFGFTRFPIQAVVEYASYNWRPEIGGFKTNDWKIAVETLVAHEMAHLVQYGLKYATNHPRRIDLGKVILYKDLGKFEGSHGDFFLNIYRDFRNEFINPRVERSHYTNPRAEFDRGDYIETAIDATETPLKGINFPHGKFPGGLTVKGRNHKTTAKLYGYYVEDNKGHIMKIKLSLLVQFSPEIRKLVETDPALKAEYAAHLKMLGNKLVANARSSYTKKRRAAMRKAA